MTTTIKEKLNQLAKEIGVNPKALKQIENLLAKATDLWEEARGILAQKKINPIQYQKAARREW